jgi:hypothetical protein
MKAFINDIQNLIVKHWGKLIMLVLVVGIITNYNDFKRGVINGWKSFEANNQSK